MAEAASQQAVARRTAAEAEAARAEADAVRYRTLFGKDEVSKQMLDRAETDARATAANLEAATQLVAGAQAQLAQVKAVQASTLASLRITERQVVQAEGRLKEAQAGPDQVRSRQSDVESFRAQAEQQRAAVEQAETESVLHAHRGAGFRLHHAQGCPARELRAGGTGPDGGGFRPHLGGSEFQGDPAHPHAARPAGGTAEWMPTRSRSSAAAWTASRPAAARGSACSRRRTPPATT